MILSIPSIIPKFRFWGAFIALVISSAIFVSAFTLMFTLNSAGENIFGTSEDILVYYDNRATTPFTSKVPEYLAKSFEQIEAVEIVNPEIFQPVVIKESTAYIRGTNYSKLMQLENGKVIEGVIPDTNQIYHAMIGKNLAERLNLNLNDTITIESIVSDQHIPIRIVGKYESGKLVTTDELLVSKEVARAIGGLDEFSVTHIRVKFDNSIITREEIINDALKLYKLKLNIQLGNNSVAISQYSVKISDQANQIVFNDAVKESLVIDLFTGSYNIQIFKSNTLKITETVELDKDTQISFDLNNYLFNFIGKVKFQSINLPNTRYEIRNHNGFVVNNGTTNENGEINISLLSDKYSITIFEGTEVFTKEFNLDKPSIISFDIDSLSLISLEDISNGTLITKNNFNVEVNGLPKNLNIMLDDIQLLKAQSQIINQYVIAIIAEDGTHELKIIHNQNSDIIISTTIFNIDSKVKLPQIENYIDGSHYRPQDTLHINTRGMINGTITSNVGQLNYVTQVLSQLILPSEIGFYKIKLEGKDIFGNNIFQEYNLIIEDNPSTGGWKEQLNQPIVKAGDQLDVWSNVNITNIIPSIGLLISIDQSLKFIVPDLPSDNYSSTVTIQGYDPFFLNFTLVNKYSNLFSLNNQIINTSITPDMNYDSSYFTISYLNQTKIDFSLQWEVMIDLGSGKFSVFPQQNISIPGDNIIIPTELLIKSKLTNTIEIINLNLIDSNNNLDFINLIDGFPSILLSGQVDINSLIGGRLFYKFNKSGELIEPIDLGDNIIQLSPGNYSANFTDSLSQSSLFWIFEVPYWVDNNLFFDISISYEWGYLNNFTGALVPGNIIVNGAEIIFGLENNPEINYFRNVDDNQIEVQITNVILGNYTINYSNGSFYTSIIDDSIILISQGINNSHLNFTINSILMSGKFFNSLTFINLDLTKTNFSFFLQNATSENISILQFSLELKESREFINKIIINSNNSFSLSILPQMNNLKISLNGEILFEGPINLFSDSEILLFFGTPRIKFNVENLNYGINSTEGIINIKKFGDESNQIFLEMTDEIQLPVGKYEISFIDGIFNTTIIQEINSSKIVRAEFDLRLLDLQIRINDLPLGDFSDFTINHKFLPHVINQPVNTNADTVLISDFPLGPALIKLNGSWGVNEFEINILNSFIVIDLVIEGKDNILSDIDFRFADKLGNLQLGSSVGDQYLDSFLEGSLLIARSILITELVIIFIIIVTNITEIFAALTYESKREIIILRNLGFTTTQTVIASTKFLLFNSLIISLFGQILGAGVIKILLDLQFTVYFGHQFYPELFVPPVFIANIAIVILLTFIGAFYNVRKEYEMKEEENQK